MPLLNLEQLKRTTVLVKIFIKSKCLNWLIFSMADLTPIWKARALRASQVWMYTLCIENDDCYAHSVDWRPSEGIFLLLAPDVAGTVYSCQTWGEEYNKGFIPLNTPRYSLIPKPSLQAIKHWRWARPGNEAISTIRIIKELKLLKCKESNEKFEEGLPRHSIYYNEFQMLTYLLLVAVVGFGLGKGRSFFIVPNPTNMKVTH